MVAHRIFPFIGCTILIFWNEGRYIDCHDGPHVLRNLDATGVEAMRVILCRRQPVHLAMYEVQGIFFDV
jgi:hypothetical protein